MARRPETSIERTRSSADGRDRRGDVIRAALALFAERGFKETTATEIAERAGISRRAFFYYFRSKDDILFSVDHDDLAILTTLASEQPSELSELEAAAAAWEAIWLDASNDDRDNRRRRATQLRRAAESSPVLRGKELELRLAYEEAVARGLARRRGLDEPDDLARAAAGMAQALIHLATSQWVADSKSDRGELFERYFGAARLAITNPSETGRGPRRRTRTRAAGA